MAEVKVIVEGVHSLVGEDKLKIGSTVTLIKSKKNILVDTGTFKDSLQIKDSLAAEGLSVEDIDIVVLTHLHLDHLANVNLFPNANILCKFNPNYPGQTHLPKEGCLVRTELVDGTKIDEGVSLLFVPGHSWDMLAVVAETDGGKIVIAGDAIPSKEFANLEKMPNEKLVYDLDLFNKNRKKILEIADYIIPGHGDKFKIN